MAGALVGCGDDGSRCVEGAALLAGADAACVEGDLVIQGRTDEALAILEHVEEITGSLVVHGNPGLIELPAMNRLVRLGGSLSIAGNADLERVTGFSALKELSGGVFVAENPALREFALGPGVLAQDSLDITANPQLLEVTGLSGVTRVTGDLRIVHDDALSQLQLPALVKVDAAVRITDDAMLSSIEMPELRTIGRELELARVGRLASLTGMATLSEVGDVRISDNAALSEIEWAASSGRELVIAYNPALVRVRGTEAVEALGTLQIRGNDALVAVEGFATLTSLHGLHLRDNALLEVLASMPHPTAFQSALQVQGNPLLVAPTPWLSGLERVDQRLWIFDNFSLDPAAVDALVTQVEVNGSLRVGDNGGEDTALDPCPWPNDNICDAGLHTDLCLMDPEDCGA